VENRCHLVDAGLCSMSGLFSLLNVCFLFYPVEVVYGLLLCSVVCSVSLCPPCSQRVHTL
jgi:hypothetical protein